MSSSLWTPRYNMNAPGFSNLFRMLDDFDKYTQAALGQSFGSNNSLLTAANGGVFNPKFDVTEDEKSYSLQGELPGVPPENIIIEFTDPQTLVIRGHAERVRTEGDPSLARIEGGKQPAMIEDTEQKVPEKAEEGNKEMEKQKKEEEKKNKPKAKYWLSERSFGEFSRVFNFPTGVDQEKVAAKFEHGVLNITVPKMEKKGARKIEIKL